MAFLGTTLANTVLESTGLRKNLNRQYTMLRANDRTHKLWGNFSQAESLRLVRALTRAGAANARVTYHSYYAGRNGAKIPSGVRFEMPAE